MRSRRHSRRPAFDGPAAPGAATRNPEAGRVLGAVFSWLDRRADRWAPQTNERATRELREAVERFALPWLDKVAGLRGARDELVRQGHLTSAAVASLELGEPEEAARLFAQALAAVHPSKADELRRWGRAHGIAP